MNMQNKLKMLGKFYNLEMQKNIEGISRYIENFNNAKKFLGMKIFFNDVFFLNEI